MLDEKVIEVEVKTVGRAYLRNGESKVTGLIVTQTHFYTSPIAVECFNYDPEAGQAGHVTISALNSTGKVTVGHIHLRTADFAELCRRFLAEYDASCIM
jgi:hypothetical protein